MDNPEGQVTYPIRNRTAGLPTSSSTFLGVHCVFIFVFIIKPYGTINLIRQIQIFLFILLVHKTRIHLYIKYGINNKIYIAKGHMGIIEKIVTNLLLFLFIVNETIPKTLPIKHPISNPPQIASTNSCSIIHIVTIKHIGAKIERILVTNSGFIFITTS